MFYSVQLLSVLISLTESFFFGGGGSSPVSFSGACLFRLFKNLCYGSVSSSMPCTRGLFVGLCCHYFHQPRPQCLLSQYDKSPGDEVAFSWPMKIARTKADQEAARARNAG